eukprot:COSAG05_NODE_1605_length_4417_cov_8.763780_3_plen_191_part_00
MPAAADLDAPAEKPVTAAELRPWVRAKEREDRSSFSSTCKLKPKNRPPQKAKPEGWVPKVTVLEVVHPVDDAPIPVEGDTVTVHYIVKNKKGKHLDPLYGDTALKERKQGEKILDKGRDMTWVVGSGDVITGLDRAVQQMNEGEHFIVNIPSELAYGKMGVPGIVGPDEILVFDLKLLTVDLANPPSDDD